MTEKLQYDEIQAIFGSTIPIAALSYLNFVSDGTTLADLRQRLTGMGYLWKDLCKQQNILEPESAHPPFVNRGTLVSRLRDEKVFFVAESEQQAQQFVLLLNLGHKEYYSIIQRERAQLGTDGDQP